jgi:predicted nucleotidyltransferase
MKLREFATTLAQPLNPTLNPKLWIGDDLQLAVRERLLRIAAEFERFVNADLTVKDITVTGSNAAYAYTAHSDIDLHLIVAGTPTAEERELFTAKKALWALEHDIRIRGLPVECYIQGESEPHHSTGIYSVKDELWLIEPQRDKPKIDDQAVRAKTTELAHLIRSSLESQDRTQAEAVKQRVVQMRKAGLSKTGEWSTENQTFKSLRRMGLIDQLTAHIRRLQDQELSLERREA